MAAMPAERIPRADPAPTAMQRRHARPVAIAKQYRQAIGGEHGAHHTLCRRTGAVGLGAGIRIGGVDHMGAMLLFQPTRPNPDTQSRIKRTAVSAHRGRIIARVLGQVERIIGR